MEPEIEQMLSEIEKPSEPRALGGESGASDAPKETPAAAEPPSWDPKPWEFSWKGKTVAPDSQEKAKTWMSQGYNYSERMAEMNRRQRELDSLADKYKGYDSYANIDAFAKSNPQWMEWVNQQFQQRQSWKPDGQVPSQVDPTLMALQDQVRELSEWRQQALQERQKQDEQRHDEALSQEIESIRGANPNIDFDAVDQSGMTLEGRILKHAAEIGTTSFRAAFRDYLHDQLLESTKAANLTAQAKAPQQAKAAGILGTSQAPRRAPSQAPVVPRGRSYDDLAALAAEEYGIVS